MAEATAPPAPPRIGIAFEQFAAYHVDRCEAAARALAGRAEVVAVEIARTSQTYAWEPSGEVAGTTKRTLFADRPFETIGWRERLRATQAALADCETAFIGIGYGRPDVIALAWLRRLCGQRTVLMSESKADDVPRRRWREAGKAVLLSAFDAALVGGPRHVAYMRALGFRRRTVTTGYDAVGLDRVRAMGGSAVVADAERPFVFVGRFVAKKNIAFLVRAFGRYRDRGGARPLVLVGGGELEPQVRAAIAAAGLADRVEITGFVGAEEVARRLANARALLLPSIEEQWGLVVNEALAFALPVAVSREVGSGDTLVRDRGNGFVLASGDAEAWAQAMHAFDDDAAWVAMREVSRDLAPAGDVEGFARAVKALAFARA